MLEGQKANRKEVTSCARGSKEKEEDVSTEMIDLSMFAEQDSDEVGSCRYLSRLVLLFHDGLRDVCLQSVPCQSRDAVTFTRRMPAKRVTASVPCQDHE